jgi:outer membrane receptor protein involved in Fe transport
MGGAVQVFSPRLTTELKIVDEPPNPITAGWFGSACATVLVGDFDTRSAEIAITVPVKRDIVQLLGRTFSTGGIPIVEPELRGSIDIAAWNRHRWLTLRWLHSLGDDLGIVATIRGFEERRSHGTHLQHEATNEKFISLSLVGKATPGLGWSAIVYAQRQSSAATTSSIDLARTVERPFNEQFAVPATTLGTLLTGDRSLPGNARTSFGFDARFVRAESRENYCYSSGAFTRQRLAGGQDIQGGLFVLHEHQLGSGVRAIVGGRVEYWRSADGRSLEYESVSGQTLRGEIFSDRNSARISPHVGVVWGGVERWRIRAALRQSTRWPTLDELYRPYARDSLLIEASPYLKNERGLSAEFGGEWTLWHRPPPTKRGGRAPPATRLFSVGVTANENQLFDIVKDIKATFTSNEAGSSGGPSATSTVRTRVNLERAHIRGIAAVASWTPSKVVMVELAYDHNDARIRRAPAASGLAGKRIARVPRNTAAIRATWRGPRELVLTSSLRWFGPQLEDEFDNTYLRETTVMDATVAYRFNERFAVFLNVQNVADTRVETAVNPAGVVSIGAPRSLTIGFRRIW